jgi:Tol biopolymer transport system component
VGSERWQQVTEIFLAAVATDPERREAFLADACGGDAALLAEVESLLAAHDEAGTFGETPLFVPAHSLEPGSAFGPYRIEELIGAGGMGEVYRARDDALERDVAIKVLPRHFASEPGPIARLGREARLLAALSDPHIGAIFGIVEAGALRGLVLEFVEGPTVADRLAAGPLSVDEALRIAHQIAEAVEAAHDKGVTHRDLKPANIKITPGGAVKVLDFGLAKAVSDDSSASQTPGRRVDKTIEGALVGTAAYMSPEQARGQRVDKRTDIWAFGCVLYEMLTGQQAFGAGTIPDTLLKVLEREPDWTLLPGAVPDAIRKLLRRCLTKDPAGRLHDIGDARLDIADAIELRPPQGLPGPRARAASWTWPRILLAAIGAAVLMVGALTISARFTDRSDVAWRNPLANAQFTRLTDFPGSEWDAAISPDGKFVAFLSDRDGPAGVFLNQIGTGRFLNLTQGKEQKNLEEGSVRRVGFSGDGSEIWVHAPESPVQVMPLMGGQPRIFLTERAANVAWSPDGARLVYHTRDEGDPIFVADSTGANVRQIFVSPRGVHNHYPAWSLDGKWIYFVRGLPDVNEMDLWRVPSSGGTPEKLTEHNSDVAYPTPFDQRTVLYVTRDQDGSGPWLWSLDMERKQSHRVSFGLERYTSVAASANAHRLVATVEDPSANLWSVPILDRPAEEQDVKRFPVPAVRALMPRFGGATLFYVSSRGGGDGLWRFQDGETQEVWKGSDGALLGPAAVSSDGRRVAFVLRRNGRSRLQLETANGTEPQTIAESLDIRGTACWSPDGKWIVTGGSDGAGFGLFKIPTEGGGAPIRIAAGLASNPVWSPDGSFIAYTGANVALYAPLLGVRPDGTPVKLPPIKLDRDGERIRFLPDGKGLVYMQGKGSSEDFWLLDLTTMKSRPLTRLDNTAAMRTFDITPDGTQIVFDRLRKNSDIVLIDLF